jgi:hypothetical protein
MERPKWSQQRGKELPSTVASQAKWVCPNKCISGCKSRMRRAKKSDPTAFARFGKYKNLFSGSSTCGASNPH